MLGEIMFDFKGKITKCEEKLQNYKVVYSELANKINEHQSQVRILENVISYQEIFSGDFIEEKEIKNFYKL